MSRRPVPLRERFERGSGFRNVGTYTSLVIERGWSLERYRRWLRNTIRLQIGAG